ncbi:hypothetical protein D8Y22_10030 [Salinadaptatus halalkaliphilus]|uniref:LVIVD repeat-containing protein n=1 Tax=Salinadaptatus halalkaliphilus TaxID=2419781 RepID=A0A4S3TLA7_9EURY|nr:hypothetical protein [Salinadaptatus halalkaliphilus]THE64944.1 hypothetical protein D8Y22_10030 [Salinadaptatus halalkaliphilus]
MQRRSLLRTAGCALSVSAIARPDVSWRQGDTDGDAYEPLGRVDVDGAAEAVVGDDGDTAYLATTTGFATVDVSDPADPAVLATERRLEVADVPLMEILDVTVDGDRLVVPGPANQGPDSIFHGFFCFDVSDPSEPALIGDPYETGYHIHNCYLDGETLYVVRNELTENTLEVFDVGDGVEQIGSWSLLEHEPGWADIDWLARYLHDVYVHDDVAYLAHWNPGTYLLDVSDPSEPEYMSHVRETDLETQRERDDDEAQFGLPGNDHYAAVDETGDLLAVGREAWATGGDEPDRPGGIDLYDVSDPDDPEHRATIDAPRAIDESYAGGLWTTAHNFELRDGELYSSWYRGGVAIHDVSDPAEPVERARWLEPETAGFWTARVADPGSVFVASSTPVIPNSPTEGALYTVPIEAGEQADPPSLTDPDDLEVPDGVASEPNATDDGDATEASSQASDDPSTADAASSDDPMAGFTATGAAVAGGVVGLEWLRRRRQ